jgi:CheY-like chemotaxis protein
MENAKIIVIDDDPDIRDSLQTILGGRNYNVVTAADRDEGMEKIRTENPDLIILDVVMSSWLDGLDMSKQLKKDPQFKVIPILMLTGVKEQTGFDFTPKEGGPEWCTVDSYIEKPVEPEVLLEEVKRLLAERA